jgi:hypothetical protein
MLMRLDVTLLAGLRSDGDDRAARAVRDHLLGDEARRFVGAKKVDLELLSPIVPGNFKRIRVFYDRRAVHQPIDRAKALSTLGNAFRDRLRRANVHRDARTLSS